MRKWIVIGGVLAVLLVGAVLVAAANLNRWLDANRGPIEAQASAALAREVTIGGLDVSLWGGLGILVRDLRVGEDPTWGDGDFLTLDEGLIHVAIWPALFGRIELHEVVLGAPQLFVLRDERGLSTDLLGVVVAVDPAAEEIEDGGSVDLSVSALRIEGGRLVFEDRSGPEPIVLIIEQLDVAVSDIDSKRPLEFELAASLLGAEVRNITAKGKIGPVLGGGDDPIAFDLQLSVDPVSLEALARVEEVAAVAGADTSLTGSLRFEAHLQGEPDGFDFDFELEATQAAVIVASDFVKPAGTPFGLDAKGRVTPTEMFIDQFTFGLDRSRIEGDARLGSGEAGRYAIHLRADALPLAGWGSLIPALEGMPAAGHLGIDLLAKGSAGDDANLPLLDGHILLAGVSVRMPDAPAVEKLEMKAVFAGRRASVRGASFEVGGAPVAFEADIDDLNAPEVRFALDSAEMPLAALGLLEPGSEADNVLLDLRVVGQADLHGELAAADARFASPHGRLQGIEYALLEGRAWTEGSVMKLEDTRVRLLGGEVRLRGSLDSADAQSPEFSGAIKLAQIEIDEAVRTQLPLLAGVAGGRLDASMTLSGKGLEADSIAQTLSGMGSIEIAGGVLQGVNIAEEVLTGVTGIPGLSAWMSPRVRERHPSLFAVNATYFRTTRAGLEVRDGRLHTKNLAIVTDEFGLTGIGSMGLDGSIDLTTLFRTSAALAATLVGVADPTRYLLDREKRLVIPVRITGRVAQPVIRPDKGFIASALKKATVGAVGSLLGNLLRGSSSSPSGGSPAMPDAAGTPLTPPSGTDGR